MPPIYNATIKKYIVAFASLFDSLEYYNDDTIPKLVKVPIVMSTREKWLVKTKEKTEIDENNTQMNIMATYPRAAFELLNFNVATDRMTNPQLRIHSQNDASFSLNRIPYDFNFNLYLRVKKFEDLLKLYEQIIPYFTPELSITVNDNLLGIPSNVPVVLNSTIHTVNYEGDFTTSRDIEATLSFTMKSWMWPPVQTISNPSTITSGNICVTIGSYPGQVTFTGHGSATPVCSGLKNVDFTLVLNGYLANDNSTMTGTLTATKADDTTFTIQLVCTISIVNSRLFGEIKGFNPAANNPISGVDLMFNMDLYKKDLSVQICSNLTGTVSCQGQKFVVIKKTIVDLTDSAVKATFDRLTSEVVPREANRNDEYIIKDNLEVL
jgi:hypothetical protein